MVPASCEHVGHGVVIVAHQMPFLLLLSGSRRRSRRVCSIPGPSKCLDGRNGEEFCIRAMVNEVGSVGGEDGQRNGEGR